MKLNNAPFARIKSGKKSVELRLYDEKRRLLRVGDCIQFTNVETGERLGARITKLQRFADFFELYRHFDKIAIGYSEEEKANAEDMYAYYSPEEITRYGVLAITVERL